MLSKEQLWEKCLLEIKKHIPCESYSTWFSPLYPLSFKNKKFVITVPNEFYKACLQENYNEIIKSTLNSLTDKITELEFRIEEDPSNEKEQISVAKTVELQQKPRDLPNKSSINFRYNFANFIVGSSNQFAHAAAYAVANNANMTYNPLFIYGGVGLGKTHLLHAIGNEILKRDPQSKIRYLSAESFTVDLIESLKRDEMQSFRKRYRPLDVLFVDDIQFLAGKDRTQEEFFYTFNTLYESHRQIVLSSDKYPKDIKNIEERLRSRFESGLIADIEAPDLETKVAIIYKKAEAHKKVIPQDVAIFLAHNIKTNIRELEGLLLRIIAFASFTHKEIGLPLAQEVLKEFIFDRNRNFSVPIIMNTAAKYFRIKVVDMKSKNRSRGISVPRQIAMYLSREYTKCSLPDIGRQFGGKDHTTVIFAHKKISQTIKDNSDIAKTTKEIIKIIECGKTPLN